MVSNRPRCRIPALIAKQEERMLAAAYAPSPLSQTAMAASRSLLAADRARDRILQTAGVAEPARAETERTMEASWLGWLLD